MVLFTLSILSALNAQIHFMYSVWYRQSMCFFLCSLSVIMSRYCWSSSAFNWWIVSTLSGHRFIDAFITIVLEFVQLCVNCIWMCIADSCNSPNLIAQHAHTHNMPCLHRWPKFIWLWAQSFYCAVCFLFLFCSFFQLSFSQTFNNSKREFRWI